MVVVIAHHFSCLFFSFKNLIFFVHLQKAVLFSEAIIFIVIIKVIITVVVIVKVTTIVNEIRVFKVSLHKLAIIIK